MKLLFVFTLTLWVGSVTIVSAQNTLTLDENGTSPSATIDQVSWLEGQWTAEAPGGTAEEYWSAPAGGVMMGMFRLIQNDDVSFYEIFTISEEDESLLLRIKHFHSDLKGWEEKEDTVDFPLVKLEDRTAWFSGLTMQWIDDNHLTVYVRSESGDGTESELVFPYRRLK